MTRQLVVDSHQHFWDPTKADYPWMTDELASIRRPIGPEDMRPIIEENGVDRTVVVQTRSDIGETREFLQIAAGTDFVAGVVGWVDLTDPAVGETLAELMEGPNGEWLVGIRHQVHDEEDPDWVARDDVVRGIGEVGKAGLAYDLLPRERELPACLKAVDAFPEMRFVVDHIAKPRMAEGIFEPWGERFKEIAKRPNVWCKLSGMVTEADWAAWTPDDLRPYVDFVMECFGEDRVMFGSDWPVCLLAADYAAVKNTLEELLKLDGREAKEKIFGANAMAFYGLTENAPRINESLQTTAAAS
ncbi:MAG: amidohydrolase family protein [Rhodospirillales bacterium]|nr:amidohydrolase family protein [Rhodospirillales bacterium]